MFEIGDFIVYGNVGVCTVEEIGSLDSPLIPEDKKYYTLVPYYTKGSKIFTPIDNKKVVMRPVISKDEAMDLVEDINNINSLDIPQEKGREARYKEIFSKCDCRELVKLIKTIYERKDEREADGKKLTVADEKFIRLAEESLFGELAIPLDMGIEEVKDFVLQQVGQK